MACKLNEFLTVVQNVLNKKYPELKSEKSRNGAVKVVTSFKELQKSIAGNQKPKKEEIKKEEIKKEEIKKEEIKKEPLKPIELSEIYDYIIEDYKTGEAASLDGLFRILKKLDKNDVLKNPKDILPMVKKALIEKDTSKISEAIKTHLVDLFENTEYLKSEIEASRKLKQLENETSATLMEKVSSARASLMKMLNKATRKLFKPNLKEDKSISERIFELGGIKGIVQNADKLLDLMPNVIKNKLKENPGLLADAMKTVEAISKERSTQKNGSKLYLPKQEGENNILATWFNHIRNDDNAIQHFYDTIDLVSIIGLSNMFSARAQTSSELEEYVQGAFGNIKDFETVSNQLMDSVKSGKFVPAATYYRELGKRVIKELNLKFDEITKQEVQDLETALGRIVLERMKPVYEVNGSYSTSVVSVVNDNGTIKYLKDLDKNLRDPLKSNAIDVIVLDEIVDRKAIDIAASVLEYAGPKTNGNINFEPGRIKLGKRVRNGNTKMSKDTVDYINRQNAQQWSFSTGFKDLYDSVKNNLTQTDVSLGKTINDEFYRLILGDKEAIIKKAIENKEIQDLDSVLAKYEAGKLEIDRMLLAYELAGDSAFYLDWDNTISGRYMIDNRMINPQNSKITRFLVNMKDQVYTLVKTKGKFKTADIAMAKAAIAQAFGMDLDKQSDIKTFNELAEEYVEFNESGKIKFANTRNGRILKKAVELYGKENGKSTALSLLKQMDIDADEIMHAYQAVEFLSKMSKGDTEISTNLALEIDAITNGMMLTMLEIGSDWAWSMLEKGGIYINKDGKYTYKNHGEFKEANNADIYETPKDLFWSNLRNSKNLDETTLKEIEKLIGGNLRKFLKPMVMVFIYGAGIKNIRLKASEELAKKFIQKYIEADDEKGLQSFFNKAINNLNEERKKAELPLLKNLKVGYAQWDNKTNRVQQTKMRTESGQLFVNDYQMSIITQYMNMLIGNPLEAAFNKSFEPVTQYRQTLKAVEGLNYLVFQQELTKKLKPFTNKKGIVEIDNKSFDAILESMQKEGTYYGAKDSAGAWQDYYKETNDPTKTNITNIKGFYTEATNANELVKLNSPIKVPTSNTGAVGVTAIHNKDGRTMFKGHINSVLNIYDALVLGVNPEVNTKAASSMNNAMVDVSTNHSILGEAYDRLIKNIEKLDVSLLTKEDLNNFENDIKWIFDISGDVDFSETKDGIIKSTVDRLSTIMNDRKNMKDKKALINHYYVTDSLEGVEVTIGDVKYSTLENLDKFEEKLNEVFDALAENSAKTEPESGTIEGTNIKKEDINNLLKGCK